MSDTTFTFFIVCLFGCAAIFIACLWAMAIAGMASPRDDRENTVEHFDETITSGCPVENNK